MRIWLTCSNNLYLNNMVEQDRSFIKKPINLSLGFKSFYTAIKTIIGYETINMIRKGRIQGVSQGDIVSRPKTFETRRNNQG
ncbi:DDE-type integrase/transposase/recombinase [Nostoc sp.]|uniref:DDE-type integrase/transposase/recombinase n=1 Tax=Nostoc sp. TaxID=1180 RepID=UPI003FA55536